MSTPGELVAVVAATLGVPEATVVVHDRNLVAAGLRTKHGRGRGAAQVTYRDAACLVVAILGSPQVRQSADTVRNFSRTRQVRGATGYQKLLGGLPADHSFVDALEAMFREAASEACALPPGIEIGALNPGTMADVRFSGLADGKVMQVRYAPASLKRLQSSRGDLEEYRRITGRTVHTVASGLRMK